MLYNERGCTNLKENRRMEALDGVRVISMLCIVCWHFYLNIYQKNYNITPFRTIVYPVSRIGYYSVEVFFLLSGFCIAYNYKKKIADYTLVEFITRRFKKIVPLALMVTIVSLAIQMFDVCFTNGSWAYKTPIDFYHILLNLFFMQTGWIENDYLFPYNAPQWFLCILLICYILYWIISRKQNTYLWACVSMCLLGYACMIRELDIPFLYTVNGRGYLAFFLGCILYEFDKKFSEKEKQMLAYIGIIINGILCLLVCKYGLEAILGQNVQLVFTVFIFPIYIISVLNIGVMNKFFLLRPLQIMKKYTFSIYLWHQPFMIALRILDDYFNLNINYNTIAAFVGIWAVIFLIGIFSYHILEMKLIPFLLLLWKKLCLS